MEIWKDIEGYEGLYQVSNLGNVKSLGNGGSNASRERILKPNKVRGGYLQVSLCKQGKRTNYLLHRLVAQAFIDNSNNYKQVNHKDENKTNNRLENLEWCDCQYNNNYGSHNQKIAESNTNHPHKSKPVMCLETGKVYPSTKEVERKLGFAQGNISKCCRGELNSCGGFHWCYIA